MVCKKCGAQLEVGEKFCPKCGDAIPYVRQRHGFVSFWLVFGVICGALVGIMYLFVYPSLGGMIPISKGQMIIAGLINLAFIVPYVLLLQWKKIGFWMYCGFSLVSLVLNVIQATQYKPLYLVGGLIGFLIMWGILHIRKNGKNTWEQLE